MATKLKVGKALVIVLLLSSCARPIYRFQDGTLLKTKRDRPTKAYHMVLAIGVGVGQQSELKHK
jgi:hypothetical protein